MLSRSDHSTFITAWKTIDDWQYTSQELKSGVNTKVWEDVAEDYYMARLEFRYLSPIRLLQEHGTSIGEGFSISAIQCTLIEFLESTVQGKSYRYLRRGETLGDFEYSSSSDIFTNFLVSRAPFLAQFDVSLANDFYTGVRCGLLHEARTKNDWRIWATDPMGRIVDANDKIVFRDNFQDALIEFINSYKAELPTNVLYQEAFIRKFDSLCT
jgi:hypothetical protein